MRFSQIISHVLGLFLVLGISARAQETVTISKSRLVELETKAARSDALSAELAEAKAELARLRKEEKQPERKSVRYLPPEVEKAAKQEPPPRPLVRLAPAQPIDVVSVNELLAHYAADPSAAEARYLKRKFTLTGVIAEVDKELFQSSYRVVFRIPENNLRGVVEAVPPEEYAKVYVSSDRERLMAEMPGRRPVILINVGTEVRYNVRCLGRHGNSVTFDLLGLAK